jgi:hypothetical protein
MQPYQDPRDTPWLGGCVPHREATAKGLRGGTKIARELVLRANRGTEHERFYTARKVSLVDKGFVPNSR